MINANKFPKIMGIVNVTPDSFSDGGLFFEKNKAIDHGLQLIADGADILDIGGESTRPGAFEIPINEEIRRVIPVIEGILAVNSQIKVSIDTTKYEVALEALGAGASIINDISGLTNDIRLARLASERDVELIVMHMQGTPRTMQINPFYEDVVVDVYQELKAKIELAESIGVKRIMADVGIGFGKTVDQNWLLLKNLDYFQKLGIPIVLGLSRKSFLGKLLDREDSLERDLPTLIVHSLIPEMVANILRVHNVKQISMLKKIHEVMK